MSEAIALSSRLPAAWRGRVRLPAIAAPMLIVSGPELVTAVARAGAIAAFPTANARTAEQLEEWMSVIRASLTEDDAPVAANLIIRSPRLVSDVEVLVRNRIELVITSVGSPAAVVEPLHGVGALVFSDVATLHHARRAIDAGVDGLVLLTAGAGGQTGWMNPFAFVRAVREMYDGPIVLAGGIGDGVALRSARELGCDLGYMGTAFLATNESRAVDDYKRMVVESSIDDIVLTSAFVGGPTNMLADSIRAVGLDPAALPATIEPDNAAALYGEGASGPRRWKDIWSAGHSVSAVREIRSARHVVDRMISEYCSGTDC